MPMAEAVMRESLLHAPMNVPRETCTALPVSEECLQSLHQPDECASIIYQRCSTFPVELLRTEEPRPYVCSILRRERFP